ncbi:MAG TPA: hypothetical protein VEF04_06285, partial [Blastocatellia bacterium]|nr:hypothetical protein [Blastocatellia bacterium]
LAEMARGLDVTSSRDLVVCHKSSCVFPINSNGQFEYNIDDEAVCEKLRIPFGPTAKYRVHALVQDVLLPGIVRLAQDDDVKSLKVTMCNMGVCKADLNRHLTPHRVGSFSR